MNPMTLRRSILPAHLPCRLEVDVPAPDKHMRWKRGTTVAAVAALTMATWTSTTEAARLEYNRALGKAPVQTSEAWGGVAAHAVDGNTDGNYWVNSVTHTQSEFQPYWQIDLGGSYNVDTIDLFNRTDCCRERLRDVFIFFSDKTEMTHRGVVDTFQQDGVQTRVNFGQAQDHHVIPIGQRLRYVRIQLGGSGILSLAEVKIVERVDVPGPAGVAARTNWVPTGIFTGAAAFSLAEVDGILHSFQRGADGTLHMAPDLAADQAVPSSPAITAKAPSVSVDRASNHVYVAVQGADGWLYVGTASPPSPGADRTWSWESVAPTEAEPSLLVVDGRLVLAWLQDRHARSTWKTVPNGSWAAPTVHIDAVTPPSLARNSRGAVGIAFLRWDGSINFVEGKFLFGDLTWLPIDRIVGWSSGRRVGLASYGWRFIVSAIGGDSRPYVAIQNDVTRPRFAGFEPAWGSNDVPILEAPTVTVFQGMIFILARDKNLALRYWMRNPDTIGYRYAAGQMWLGGRIVSEWGVGATPPALATVGPSRVWGIWDGPAELYVATRGIGDRQLYGLNFGRFASLDLLQNVFGIRPTAAPSNPDLDVRAVRNLFEHLVAFLALPTSAWDKARRNPGCSPATAGVQLLLDPDTAGQTRAYQCPPVMYLNGSYQHAFFMFHEWMHMDFARRGVKQWNGFQGVFGSPAPRLCQTSTDCGGDVCALADDQFGWFDDPPIRQWIGKKVCLANGRPQGHATFYSVESDEHDFIETAQMYRWQGDTLRSWALRDYGRGNPRLLRMYEWMRDYYFDGITYNGNGNGAPPRNDRTFGFWGMPAR